MSAVVQRLTNVFRVDAENPVAFLSEIKNLCNGYSDAEQNRAAEILLQKHKYKTFPLPSEVLAALMVARDQINPPKFEDRTPVKPGWSKTEIAHADQLVQCDIGRTAADEGWIRGLHEWIAKNHRFPSQGELSGIKARSMAIRRDAEDFIASGRACVVVKTAWDGHLKLLNQLSRIAYGNDRMGSHDET